MKLYKLTNHNNRTHNGCKWAEDCEHHASGNGGLCGPGWLHAYPNYLRRRTAEDTRGGC